MGCSTCGVIKQRLSGEQILEAIQKLFDPEAELTRYMGLMDEHDQPPYKGCALYNKTDSKYIDECAKIWFNYNEERRGLLYISNNYRFLDKDGKAVKWYDEFEHTQFDLSYWGSSVEIMEKLVAELGGGWVQINDCSSSENESKYHEVESVKEPFIPSTKTIITMTYDELCKKLGGTVVITDRRMGGV